MADNLLFCGIDGGGTSSKCALSDGKKILTTARHGSSNIYAVGFETAFQNVKGSIEECLKASSKDRTELDAIHLASAGLGDDKNKNLFINVLKCVFPNARVSVSDDAYPLFYSSGLDGTGVVAISGTGSIAFGINSEGERVRAGGYGWRLGDEGSAYHIAYEAIRRSLRASEGLEATTVLTEDVVKFFKLNEIKDVIYLINSADITKSEIADFAPAVLSRSYRDKDPVAHSILDKEVDEFASYVVSVTQRLKGEFEHKILLSGGLVDNSAEYRSALIKKLKSACPSWITAQAEEGAAVKGCLKLASR